MKLLVVCQYYLPEPFRVHRICEGLVARGHKVTVLTGRPNYPMGEIYEGYGDGSHDEEMLNGVRVIRVRALPRKQGIVHRFLNYYSYPILSSRRVMRIGEFDAVLVLQLSPVMMAWAGKRYTRAKKLPLHLYCFDLWPESLAVGGISRTSLIFKYFKGVSGRIYKSCDRIYLSSRQFAEYFEKTFGMPKDDPRFAYLPQFAEEESSALPEAAPHEGILFTFAGNVGKAQDLDTLFDAIALLKKEGRKDLRFRIVGDGVELERLRKRADGEGLPVEFTGRVPAAEMPRILADSDAMLVTLEASELLSYTLPGKVQTAMSAGKPILAAANGEVATVLADAACGEAVPSGDAAGYAAALARFAALSVAERQALGENGRRYYNGNFTLENLLDRLEADLTKEG